MKTYKIHFIRNGFTEGNLSGKYIGHTDEPLTKECENILRRLVCENIYPNSDVYITSPLKRCIDTIRIINPATTPLVINDLIEYNFGEFEGKTADELSQNENFINWISVGGDHKPPFGESNTEFYNRISGIFEKVVEGLMKSGTTTATICTHGGVIMALLEAYGLPERKFYEWMTPSCSGYSVLLTPSIWMRIRKMEIISHIYDKKIFDESGLNSDLTEKGKLAMRRAYGDTNEND